jgi:hypothetical protein
LAGEFDGGAYADGLAVPELFALGFAEAGVGVVSEVSHSLEGGIRV